MAPRSPIKPAISCYPAAQASAGSCLCCRFALSSSRREDLDIEARSKVRERCWLRQCGKTIGGDELVPVNENAGSLERIRPVVQWNGEQPVRSFNVR